jgi:hypothetical protein
VVGAKGIDGNEDDVRRNGRLAALRYGRVARARAEGEEKSKQGRPKAV